MDYGLWAWGLGASGFFYVFFLGVIGVFFFCYRNEKIKAKKIYTYKYVFPAISMVQFVTGLISDI